MTKLLLICAIFCIGTLKADSVKEKAFRLIYKHRIWGKNGQGEGHSGAGSTMEATEEYRAFLQKFLQEHEIKSVVDVGCGDWQFSQAIDWSGIEYLGIDVVKSLIDRNTIQYGSPNISFRHSDGVEMDLPEADLLICKDVLQHLPNKDARLLIDQFPKFKYCLITNDIFPSKPPNEDIICGGYRYIDITRPPFNVEAIEVLTYKHLKQRKKQVLLVQRS